MIAIQREVISDISAYREFVKGGILENKPLDTPITYGNFNKEFIYNKMEIYFNKKYKRLEFL